MPHLSVDPVVVSAHVITALQTIVSRNVSPLDALVISICSMATSQIGAFNVIPDDVRPGRHGAHFPAGNARPGGASHRRNRRAASRWALGASADDRTSSACYPATVNSEREADVRRQVGDRVFGSEQRRARRRPHHGRRGLLLHAAGEARRLRVARPGRRADSCFLHNPGYDFNDEVIPLGAGYLAALVEEALPLR